MKFVMALKKHGKGTATIAKGHNLREYTTNSQLPENAWITKQGRHTVTAWRDDVMEAAKALAKRKDAVVAVEIVLQVGNQSDWRQMPTSEHPEGKPKPGANQKLKGLFNGAREAIEREFGKENVVSIEMHTDESTPHVHAVVVPVKDGKLQAKHWLGGHVKCAQLRERLHATVNRYVQCEYTKGAPGGDPHDKAQRAGGPAARRPVPPEPDGWVEKVKGLIDKSDEVKRLKAGLDEVQQQLGKTQQDLAKVFSQLKAALKRSESAEKRADLAQKEAEKERKEREKVEKLAGELREEVRRLRPKQKEQQDLGFGQVLSAAAAPRQAPQEAPEARPVAPRGPRPR